MPFEAVVAMTMTTATLALISYTVVSVLSVKAISYTNNILGETFGCLVADGPGTNQGVVLATLTTSWSTATAFETVMLLLLIPRYLSHSRTPRRDLLGVLLRDGMAYFAIIFLVDVANVVSSSVTPTKRQGLLLVLTPWQAATQSIAGSHILLNLRREAHKGSPSAPRPSDFQTMETFVARPQFATSYLSSE